MDLSDEGHPLDIIFRDFRKAIQTQEDGNTRKTTSMDRELPGEQKAAGGTKSDKSLKWRRVYSGVLQGSVLGPILFLIYINDLPDYIMSSCKIIADDTKIYAKVGNMADVERIQEDIGLDQCCQSAEKLPNMRSKSEWDYNMRSYYSEHSTICNATQII